MNLKHTHTIWEGIFNILLFINFENSVNVWVDFSLSLNPCHI